MAKLTSQQRDYFKDRIKDQFDDRDKKISKYLWEHEYISPFRYSFYTFHCKMPLFVAR